MNTDVLIIGQGLAGSTLAWRLAERQIDAVVVDRGGVDQAGRPSSSRVAAGLVTPVTGKRMTLAPDWTAMRAAAETFYRNVEQRTGATLFQSQPALRLFASAAERQQFLQRYETGSYGEHARLAPDGDTEFACLPQSLLAQHGGFWMPTAARLDTRTYLSATRKWLASCDRYIQASIDSSQLEFCSNGVAIDELNITARQVVFCQGFTPHPPPWLVGLPLAPVKGELLAIESAELDWPHVTHRGIWLAPDRASGPHRYLVGATYDRTRRDAQPTAAGKAELLGGLAELIDVPFTVLDHFAAIRPATKDRMPLAALSPTQPRVGWLSGLGAKGALWAPWYADRLAHLLARSQTTTTG